MQNSPILRVGLLNAAKSHFGQKSRSGCPTATAVLHVNMLLHYNMVLMHSHEGRDIYSQTNRVVHKYKTTIK